MADNAPKDKLNLKQIFGCVDMNYKGAWNEFSDEEKKRKEERTKLLL